MNFPGSFQTPGLTPQLPPKYFGFGPISSNVALLSIAPMVSLQLTDRLAMGGGPIITSGTPTFSPAFFAPGPKDALGISTFPAATNTRADWGAGFQLGLFYELSEDWNLGFSYKSPVWQEKWDYNAATPRLVGRTIGIQAGLPEIISWGVAYKGLARTLFDVDLRYIDYANTPLFGTKVVDGGLGWQSVFAVAFGVQYKATDRLTLLGGYLYNTNPVRNETTLFNVQAPGIITNTLSLGASFNITEDITTSSPGFMASGIRSTARSCRFPARPSGSMLRSTRSGWVSTSASAARNETARPRPRTRTPTTARLPRPEAATICHRAWPPRSLQNPAIPAQAQHPRTDAPAPPAGNE